MQNFFVSHTIFRSLFCIVISFGYVLFFSQNWRIYDWKNYFVVAKVNAVDWPGADSRNIQISAYCSSKGDSYYDWSDCQQEAIIVKSLYPIAKIGQLTYPPIWGVMYEYFQNIFFKISAYLNLSESKNYERFFRLFWGINTFLFAIIVVLYGVKNSIVLLPFALLSPTSLFMVERGNIDGATLFFTFIPFIVGFSPLVAGMFIGFSTSLKWFPIFSILGYFRDLKGHYKNFFLGLIITAPLVVHSFIPYSKIIEFTVPPQTFSFGYGMLSIFKAHYFTLNPAHGVAVLVFYSVFLALGLIIVVRNDYFSKYIIKALESLGENDRASLIASLSIFLGTFFVFTNWSYRLIFLIPALFVFFNSKNLFFKVLGVLVLSILWVPLVNWGWGLQHLLCWILAPVSLYILAIYLVYQIKLIKKSIKKIERKN
jgi:hypothetical protein